MTIIPLLVALLLVSSLSVIMLAASAATARLAGDRRLAVEAALTLETALARARVEQAAVLNALANGERRNLSVSGPPGWTVIATASREATGDGGHVHRASNRGLRRDVHPRADDRRRLEGRDDEKQARHHQGVDRPRRGHTTDR